MKFGIRECSNIVFRAKQNVKIGNAEFKVGQPVLYIDTATTSSMEQASTTVYAQGGRGNVRLLAWEGDKTLTFSFTDALLSPIGFHVLSGAGLFKSSNANELVHFHVTSMASISDNKIDLEEAIAAAGIDPNAAICSADAPLFVLGIEDDGSLTGEVLSGATVDSTNKQQINITHADANVMVDYYVDLPGLNVWEADITPDTFAGYYYVEADTLFRQQATGKDMPANLTFPNAKVQSNFTITMAGTGDPSSFDFTIDAFPGYTYFDKTKKVLCVLQIAEGGEGITKTYGKPVMLHDEVIQHEEPTDNDSDASNDSE